MPRNICWSIVAAAVLAATFMQVNSASASVFSVSNASFSGTPVTLTGLPDSTEVNGLTTSGVHFTYLLGGTPTNGAVVIDGGPGVTNHISPPNVVSVGNNSGILQLTLPSFESAFGFGFAVLSDATLPAATTITLFNGSTNVGSLAYAGSPDPLFTGGFAGIGSTTPFNIVDITFDSANASAFAADNFVFTNTSPVPEPGTLLLVGAGLTALIPRRRKTGPCDS